MLKQQLNLLVQLATIDQSVDEKELNHIQAIAKANGFSEDDVKELLRNPAPINLQALTDEERFEYLYMVIQLMKIDGKVFKSEIVFCEDIAQKLGYKKSVVAELSKNIYSDPRITADRAFLMEKASKFRIQ